MPIESGTHYKVLNIIVWSRPIGFGDMAPKPIDVFILVLLITPIVLTLIITLSLPMIYNQRHTLISIFILDIAFIIGGSWLAWKRQTSLNQIRPTLEIRNVESRSSEDKPPPYEAAISEVPPYEVVIMQMNCKSNTTTEETDSQAERSPLTAEDEVATLTRVSQGHDPDLPTYQEATALTISTEV